MTIWGSEWWFLFLFPLMAISVWLWLQRKKRRASLQFSSLKVFKQLRGGLRVYFSKCSIFFKLASLVFVIIALARPQKADVKVNRTAEGIDIILALDVSDSMLIEDMEPENRLEASKETIRKFILKRPFDRIGLLVFSGESYTRVPMTLDHPILLENLKEVKTTRNIKMGTAIGVALANAVGRLRDSKAKSRVIVFLTDGENNSGTIDPETALDIAKGYGVKIYSIGMGEDGQTKLPIYSNIQGKKVKRYRPIFSKVNEKLLKKMADDTGGKYFRANTFGALDGVFVEIDRLEKTKINVSSYTRYAELFPQYLKWALALYLLSFLLEQIVLRRGP